ncbi:hypothetical protein D3C72_2377900 [compost metagenome]
MPIELWLNGDRIAWADAAALHGASAWGDIEPSIHISDGSVNAVLRDVIPGWPPLPAGAIPVT